MKNLRELNKQELLEINGGGLGSQINNIIVNIAYFFSQVFRSIFS